MLIFELAIILSYPSLSFLLLSKSKRITHFCNSSDTSTRGKEPMTMTSIPGDERDASGSDLLLGTFSIGDDSQLSPAGGVTFSMGVRDLDFLIWHTGLSEK